MIWLQSNNRYDEIAQYDHVMGAFSIFSRNNLGSKTPNTTQGMFSILSNVFVALYKYRQELFVRIGNQSIPLTNDVVMAVSGDMKNRLLTIKKEGKEIAHFNYELNDQKIFSEDMTPFIDDEDFDFGLFLSNISTNDKRKEVLLGLDEK